MTWPAGPPADRDTGPALDEILPGLRYETEHPCPRLHLADFVPVAMPAKAWVQLAGWILAHDHPGQEPAFIYDVLQLIANAVVDDRLV